MATPASAIAGGVQCPTCATSKYKGALPTQQGKWQICPTCNGTTVVVQQPIRVPYDYVLPNAVLTALQAGVTSQQQIDQDSDFEAVWIVANSTGTYSVQITDPSTGRPLSNANVNGENFAGTAQLPFPLVEPYVWARSSIIKASFTDRSNGGNTIQLVIRGFKLFPRNNPAQGSQGALVQS